MGQAALQLAGTIGGAVLGNILLPGIGGAIGAAIGGELGGAAGAALFPTSGPQPPKIRITDASFGDFLPWGWGVVRVPGKIIWADPAGVKQSAGSSGGKGGGQSNATATLTFHCAFLDCPIAPITSYLGLLFDGKHVMSTVGANAFGSDLPITYYNGSGDQLPDPVGVALEADISGYVFTAYISCENLDISSYGRLPNIEAMIATHGGSIPWRVNSWTPPHFSSSTQIVGAEMKDGVITIGQYVSSSLSPTYQKDTYALDGTHIATTVASISVPTWAGGSGAGFIPCLNSASIAFAWAAFAGDANVSAWFVDGGKATGTFDAPPSDDILAVQSYPFLMNGALYACGGGAPGYVAKFLCPDNLPSTVIDAHYDLPAGAGSAANSQVLMSDDGNIWVTITYVSALIPVLIKLDADLNFIQSWVLTDLPAAMNDGKYVGIVHDGNLLLWSSTFVAAILYSINDDGTFTETGSISSPNNTLVYLDNGYVICPDGILSLSPPTADVTVGQAISDLYTAGAALNPSDFNVDEQVDVLPSYLLTSQVSVAGAVQQLLTFSASCAVESDFVIKHPKLNKDPVVEFADDDFAWTAEGDDLPGDLPDVMDHEKELPRSVTVQYMNTGADLQPGAQTAPVQTTTSTLDTTLALGIGMSDQKAMAIAGYLRDRAWLGRDKLSMQTSRAGMTLDAGDNVTAKGRLCFINDKTDAVNGISSFNFEGADAKIFSQAGVASASTGMIPRNPASSSDADASLVMLDIPLVRDSDQPGPYAATAFDATLFESSDGINYTSVGPVPAAGAIGTVTTPLGDFQGGNILDFQNISQVTLTSGNLSGVTNEQLLNDANLFAFGNGELAQSRDVTLVSPSVYNLATNLRGRRGTEFVTVSHVAGESFVALPVTSVPLGISEFGRLRYYKAVRAGQTLADATAVPFTCNGAALRPYAPVQLGGGTDGSGNVTLNWRRRTRVGGAWPILGDVPLSETTEAYVVQIWDSTFTNVARLINATAQTCSYTSAQQVTDFGSQQKHIYFTVQQVGSYGIGTAAHGIAGGFGSSDTSVGSPIPPYGGSPPLGSSGCTLPVTRMTLPWTPVGVKLLTEILDPSMDLIIEVTTPGTIVAGSITITMAEYPGDSGPIPRNATLSYDDCGPPITPDCQELGSPSPTFTFFMTGNPLPTLYPTIAINTTIRVTVNSLGVGSMFALLEHA